VKSTESKLISVRIPAAEFDFAARVFSMFPGVSPAFIIRALIHSSTRISVGNALSKHSFDKSKGIKK
jgi:hypothetical protein